MMKPLYPLIFFRNFVPIHGNPGDYAWGVHGLDNIITQVRYNCIVKISFLFYTFLVHLTIEGMRCLPQLSINSLSFSLL